MLAAWGSAVDDSSKVSKGSPAIRLIVRSAVGLMLILVAVGIFGVLRMTKAEPERAEEAGAAILVPVITTRLVDAPRIWEGYGTARALRASNVASEVGALVIDRPARIEAGHEVVEGEMLVELDATAYVEQLEAVRGRLAALEAQLEGLDAEREAAEAKLDLAIERTSLMESEVRRLEAALSSGGVTEVELERQRRELARVRSEEETLREVLTVWPSRQANVAAQLTSERAALRLAERDVEHTRINAPFDGTLQDVRVNRGERVAPGQVVARLVDLRRIEVPIRIGASASGQIRTGDDATLTRVGATNNGLWRGRVARIAPEADTSTRTITIFAEVEQDGAHQDALLPGQFVVAQVTASGSDERVVVPRRAVQQDRVLVVTSSGEVEVRSVRVERYIENSFMAIDAIETQWAVIGSGLEAGAQVIVTNSHTVPPGTVVRPVDRALARDGGGASADRVTP